MNAKVGEIASDVGSTPQAWNSGIFNMLRSLSETVVLPIAAAILCLLYTSYLAGPNSEPFLRRMMIAETISTNEFRMKICSIVGLSLIHI